MDMRDVDRGAGVLIALHGHADDPSSARAWGRQLAPNGWEVIAPGASENSEGVRSWFSTSARGAVLEELRASAHKIGDLVERLQLGGSRVVVAGFSQGGALAMSLNAFGVQPDAVISICGFFPEAELSSGLGEVAAPVLIINAAEDELVPSFLGEDATALLTSQGAESSYRLVSGDHRVSADAVDISRRWLAALLSPGVKISLGLPVDRVETGAELVSGAAVADLAVGYERLGFHAAFVTDHPAPDDRWLSGGGHHALEPTVALAFAAAATDRLLLHTNVYVLPYRNPFLAAKALGSLDLLSGGRLVLGVAAGYLKPEFAAVGAEFESRGAQLDESLQMMRRIWTQSSIEAEGSDWSARSVTSLPHLAAVPPIWIGGNSTAAVRRAIRFGQGWSPFPTPVGSGKGLRTAEISSMTELAARIKQVHEMCEEAERTEALSICFVPFCLSDYLLHPTIHFTRLIDEVAELSDLGVDWLALSVPGDTRSAVLDNARELASALNLA
ncbi:MAG: TIGR03619 family F420-dependent LLM class oxidoreductase [Microthrixaceae bacterium]